MNLKVTDIAQYLYFNPINIKNLLKDNDTFSIVRNGVKLDSTEVSVGDTVILNVEDSELYVKIKKFQGRKPSEHR